VGGKGRGVEVEEKVVGVRGGDGSGVYAFTLTILLCSMMFLTGGSGTSTLSGAIQCVMLIKF
jgi:hypothetical protein